MKSRRKLSPIYLDDPGPKLFPEGVPVRRRGKKLIAFGWYGGKFNHLNSRSQF